MATRMQKLNILSNILSSDIKEISEYEELFKQNNYMITVKAKHAAKYFHYAETIKLYLLIDKDGVIEFFIQLHFTSLLDSVRRCLNTLGFTHHPEEECFTIILDELDVFISMLLGAGHSVFKTETIYTKDIWKKIKNQIKDPITNIYENELFIYPKFIISNIVNKRHSYMEYRKHHSRFYGDEVFKFSSFYHDNRYYILVRILSSDQNDAEEHVVTSLEPLTPKRLVNKVKGKDCDRATRLDMIIYFEIFTQMMKGELDWSSFKY